jgi:hypothetical protein
MKWNSEFGEVQIDNLLYEAIVTLNEKGWTTFTCCQGHTNPSKCTYGNAYISFDTGDRRRSAWKRLPNGWCVDDEADNYGVIIRHFFAHRQMKKQIERAATETTQWARELAPFRKKRKRKELPRLPASNFIAHQEK